MLGPLVDGQTLQPLIEQNIEKEAMIFARWYSVYHNLTWDQALV